MPTEPVGLAGPDARLALLQRVRELLPNAVTLSVTLYLENFSVALRQAIEYGAIPQAIPADVPVAYLSQKDHAALVVAALEDSSLAGELLRFGGAEAHTGPELAAVVGEALGRPVAYQALPPEAIVPLLTPLTGERVAAQVAEMYAWEGSTGRDLLAPDSGPVLDRLGVRLPTLREWARAAFGAAR